MALLGNLGNRYPALARFGARDGRGFLLFSSPLCDGAHRVHHHHVVTNVNVSETKSRHKAADYLSSCRGHASVVSFSVSRHAGEGASPSPSPSPSAPAETPSTSGRIEVITGPMFAGKTTALVRVFASPFP